VGRRAAQVTRYNRLTAVTSEQHELDCFEHAHRARAFLVVRADQPERPLIGGQRHAIAFIRDENRLVPELRVDFAESEDDLISVMRFREDVACQRLASQLAFEGRSRALQNIAQQNAFILDGLAVRIRNSGLFPRHRCEILRFERKGRRDVAGHRERG